MSAIPLPTQISYLFLSFLYSFHRKVSRSGMIEVDFSLFIPGKCLQYRFFFRCSLYGNNGFSGFCNLNVKGFPLSYQELSMLLSVHSTPSTNITLPLYSDTYFIRIARGDSPKSCMHRERSGYFSQLSIIFIRQFLLLSPS